ncbi:MAG: hypothetical protein V4726_06635 [Verrucomicrobiota bacterium]
MSTSVPIITGGSAPVTIPAGDIQFYDRFSPPLPAGNYTLSTSQTVGGVQNINDGVDPVYAAPDQPLLITGPRFSLSARDVYSMYPPAGNVGTFQDHLPHVVLCQKSFPWTRSIVDLSVTPDPVPAPTDATPWIAVLTFYPGDVQASGQSLDPADGPYVSLPRQMSVPDIVAGGSTVLAPQITPTASENDLQATVVEMTYGYFKSIAPSQSDLPFLAHGRQVNTEGKALAGDQAKGYFSLAVGNRVVQPNLSTVPAPVQTAVLVSLEGQWNRLPGGSDAADPANDSLLIRLVVLASWTFGALPAGGDFLYLMGNLGVDLLRLPSPAGPTADPDSDPQAQAVQALALGYVPLGNDLRDGENTTSYYRGPGAAAPCATDMNYGPYHYSDSTIQYDPAFGTFNLSYAAAFQVGRLLALSDGSFCQTLIQWRNDYFYRLLNTLKVQAVQVPLEQAVAGARHAEAEAADAAGDYGPEDGMKTTVLKLFHGVVGAPLFSEQPKVPLVSPRHRRRASGTRPGVLSPEEIGDLHAAGEDPAQVLRRKIAASTDSDRPQS